MKKQIVVMLVGMFLTLSVFAQNGQGARQTPEERTKSIMEKLADLKLTGETATKVEIVFADFYKTQQKTMEDMRASGSFDREAMEAKRQQLSMERDSKLKTLLTADQLKKWTDEIEPSLRHPKRNN